MLLAQPVCRWRAAPLERARCPQRLGMILNMRLDSEPSRVPSIRSLTPEEGRQHG